MKKIVAYTLTLMMIIMTFVACGTGEAQKIAVTNGVIYTVEGDSWDTAPAEAMVIAEDGTIEFVGSDSDAEEFIDGNTEVYDLEGKTVLPGFVDSHVHPPGTLMTELYQIDLYGALTFKDFQNSIKDFVEANADLDTYWGEGFSMGIVDKNGKAPCKEWIDEVCPDKPVLLISSDHHNVLLNSKALEICKIDKKTTHPTGNVHKDKNGEPTGLLTDASSLVTIEQEYTPEQEKEGLLAFIDRMNGWGYTALSSAGHLMSTDPLLEVDSSGEFTMHANLSGGISPETWKEDVDKLDELKEATKDCTNIKVETGKFFIDGVIEGCTGYLKEPYTAAAGKGDNYKSTPLWDQDEMTAAMTEVMKRGYTVHVHSIGDAATEMTVNSIEAAQKANGDQDYRNTITHLQVVADKDIERMGKLDIIAAVQPFWHLKEPDWYETVDELVLGEERAWNEYPLKSFIDAGAKITSSGDYPVSPLNNPFWAIETGVTRNMNNPESYGVDEIKDMDDPTYLLNPEERVTVKQMVEAYTINGAYQMRSEDTIGSLEEGKIGDFIVINQDVMKADPLKIDKTKVLATVYGGQVVNGELSAK